MSLSRRQFNRHSRHFFIGAFLPSALSSFLKVDVSEETVHETVKSFFQNLDPETELSIPTYLGNPQRRYYGRGVPTGLNIAQKFPLGTGVTYVGSTRKVWSGAGWTGQPTITRDRGRTYLIIGSYDYHLRKIDFETNEEVWKYKFDDVIKGSSSVYIDETADENNRIVILQGSRTGRPKGGLAPSFRAISFRTGQELWKLDIRKTLSYSRDNDSSALYLENGIIFNAGENGIGYFLDSATKKAGKKSGFLQPKVFSEVQLYEKSDRARQGGNLVCESSPARLDDRLFVAAGSGHIYGIDINTRKISWDFFTGSDLDGTVAVSRSRHLFCAIEKQYIPGRGGAIKLNPDKPPAESVEWFLPTGNAKVGSWEGGIIGSVSINDEYNPDNFPPLFATHAIDGYLYVGSQEKTTGDRVPGPSGKGSYNTPVVLAKQKIGPSISTPIFTDGYKLVTAGYNGVYLFQLNWETAAAGEPGAIANSLGDYYRLNLEAIGRFKPGISFESTPVVWDGNIIICSRDGWLYTLN